MPPREHAPGAIPVLLHAQLRELLNRHAVTLLTVAGPDLAEQEAVKQLQRDGLEVHAALRTQPQGRKRWARRLQFASAWLGHNWPWRTVWFWEPAIQQHLNRLKRESRFDIIQVEDNAMGVYDFSGRALRILTEYEVRRPRRTNWRPGPPANWPQWLTQEANWQRWAGYQRQVWQRFDHLQVFTQSDAQAMTQLAPNLAGRIHVNPFGLPLPPSCVEPAAEQADTLLFVGDYTHWPNVDAALWLGREILPRLRQLRPAARLVLVGAFAPPELRALAGPGLSIAGVVPEMGPYFCQAAVVAAPVRVGGGMRTKVLLAMAYGKAVVTTHRGTEGLALDGLPLPVETAEDADGLAQAIAGLLADDQRRRSLGQAARAYVADHCSADQYVRRSEALYAEAMRAA
jgi:glycosyltransferase involved in cell wall biosynthesis